MCGFHVFGVDGSRLELPRTESNEARFSPATARRRAKPKPRRSTDAVPGAATFQRGRPRRPRRSKPAHEEEVNSPQMWLTTMFHVGTGLPWDWRTRTVRQQRARPPAADDRRPAARALVTADAGFVGYEYWKALLDSGRHLLIRVGANVRLLRKLGYVQEKHGLVYLWPDREAARNQPPLVLRLVVAGGKHPVYLVTSVLDEATLSDNQVVEIYALRWGMELFYRHFKQTFERRKLRSHSRTTPSWRRPGRCWACGR